MKRVERKAYRMINGVPVVFGFPINVFLPFIVPIIFFIFFMGVLGGSVVFVFSLIFFGLIIAYLYKQIIDNGRHFLVLKIHSFRNTWWVIKRQKRKINYFKINIDTKE